MARDLGADALATGHYARRVAGSRRARAAPGCRSRPRPELFPLRHHAGAARFPALSAGRLRARPRPAHLARRFALPVAEKPDSQDICFVPQGDYAAHRREAAARRGRAGRDRRRGGARAGTPCRHHPFHGRPAQGARHRRRRAALRAAARARDAPRGGRAARGARTAARRDRRRQLARRRARGRELARRRSSCARPSRRCRRRSRSTARAAARWLDRARPRRRAGPGLRRL